MSKKITSISFINGSAAYIELVRTPGGSLTLSPSGSFTSASLHAACGRADEIHISSLFPSASYEWTSFPRVQERYLRSIISSTAKSSAPSVKVSTRYKNIRDVVRDGNPGSLVAYQVVEEEDLNGILKQFDRYRRKITKISTLPSSLAAAVVTCEDVADNFLFLWAGENRTVIGIASADGIVKIARDFPYGMPGEEDTEAAAEFAVEIGREVMMTVNYFKQKFREPGPTDIYLLGDGRLRTVFIGNPLEDHELVPHYGLAGLSPENVDNEKFNSNVHLFGNLFTDDAFNFLPMEEVRERQTNRAFTTVLLILMLLIGLTGFWTTRIPSPQSNQDLVNRIHELRFDIGEIKTAIAGLTPIGAKKDYYRTAFLAEKPEFIGLLQQIGAVVPDNMIFKSFRMTPGDDLWNCMIVGEVRGGEWQERLDTLREFGRALYGFPRFDIQNVTHSLGQAGLDASSINFQLSLQYIPGEETP